MLDLLKNDNINTMNTEIEVKFVNIDQKQIREKLKTIGAICNQPMRNMRRVTIDTPIMKAKNAFLRVRDQGDKITLTYKQFDSLSLHGAKEIELDISDFDKAVELFAAVGIPHHSHQESRRETWKLDDTEIVLDEWPWLDPLLEIEGPSEKHVKDITTKLGLDWEKAIFGDVMSAYKVQYPYLGPNDTIGNLKEVKFGDPLPDLLKPKHN